MTTVPLVGAAAISRTSAFGGMTLLEGSAFRTRLRPHVHSSYVFGVVERGAVEVTADGQARLATAGSVIAIPPFIVHTEIPAAAEGWSFRYVYPSEHVVRELLGIPPGEGPALRFASPVLDDVRLATTIRSLVDRLRSDGDGRATESLLANMIRSVATHAASYPGFRLPRERRSVRAVRAMLTEHPRLSVSLSELAGAAGLSPFHFLRVFKAEIGLTPYAYYEQVRIAYANEMICAGLDPSTVAHRLGYSDQSHLTRQFRRGSFTTPGRLSQLASDGRRGRGTALAQTHGTYTCSHPRPRASVPR